MLQDYILKRLLLTILNISNSKEINNIKITKFTKVNKLIYKLRIYLTISKKY